MMGESIREALPSVRVRSGEIKEGFLEEVTGRTR
jgi:hypothetical protein